MKLILFFPKKTFKIVSVDNMKIQDPNYQTMRFSN